MPRVNRTEICATDEALESELTAIRNVASGLNEKRKRTSPQKSAPPLQVVRTRTNVIMSKHRIYSTSFASVYPHYLTKAEKKGRTKAEVDEVVNLRFKTFNRH